MEDTSKNNVESAPEVQNPSRRRLLKFLAAGGAVTAVSLLPGKWSSPKINTGVLPVHAQVTPGRYQVACSESITVEEDEVNFLYVFGATAWMSPSNEPLVGVDLRATLDVDGSFSIQTRTTDVNGEVFFSINAPLPQFADAVATVTFDDQGTYGTDQCQTFYRIQIPE